MRTPRHKEIKLGHSLVRVEKKKQASRHSLWKSIYKSLFWNDEGEFNQDLGWTFTR